MIAPLSPVLLMARCVCVQMCVYNVASCAAGGQLDASAQHLAAGSSKLHPGVNKAQLHLRSIDFEEENLTITRTHTETHTLPGSALRALSHAPAF